jgi:phospholipase/carboxylesterase
MTEFDGIERELGGDIELAVIWLHGLGADAGDFLPIVDSLALSAGTRFVFPNAPFRPVTINDGLRMRAWFDVTGFGPDAPVDEAGLSESVARVRALGEREIERGIAPQRVLFAGFSQGGAVALHAGLGAARPPGAILGLSTYLPAPGLLAAGTIATGVPVRLAHGTHDPVISLALAERSAGWLVEHGVAVEWTTYPMGHEVSWPEIADISAWLKAAASR